MAAGPSDAVVSQTGVLVIGGANPAAAISQTGVLVVGGANPQSRISQMGLLVITERIDEWIDNPDNGGGGNGGGPGPVIAWAARQKNRRGRKVWES